VTNKVATIHADIDHRILPMRLAGTRQSMTVATVARARVARTVTTTTTESTAPET
jgi:hypothetical protein